MKTAILTAVLVWAAMLPLAAQEAGFGFGADADGGGGGALTVSVGGEVGASLLGYVDDFTESPGHAQLGDVFSGKLRFAAETSLATGVMALKLAPGPVYYGGKSPVYIDEAYVGVYLGIFDIEAGLRKLAWGKADSLGPLDVINPLDYSDLSDISDTMNLKIPRPLVHISARLGQFSKLEGVFVPGFEPARFADSGRWAPEQFASLGQFALQTPDTATLEHAQAGLRYTTAVGGAADIGAQYYYGRLAMPALSFDMTAMPPAAVFAYNPYHQIGVDWAQVIAGFNLRAEAAVNLTEDLGGDDGAVYNPSVAWSFGFDRSLFAGIDLNLQCNETIRLLDDKIEAPQDIEGDADLTSTRITAQLSKKFLRDALELKAAAIWEIESGACLVMPALVWTKNDVAIELSGGVFAGSDEGLFGQFHDNSFVKLGMKHTF
jgi:hypothetical protein